MRAPTLKGVTAGALAIVAGVTVVLAPPSSAHAAYTADRLPAVPIVAGYRRAYALQDGALKGWGYDADGTLGDGAASALSKPQPKAIVGLTKVKQVAHSYTHAIALKEDGTVWTWGNNASGQLGRAGDIKVPTQVPGISGATWVEAGNSTSFAVVGGVVYAWGLNSFGQLGVGDKNNRSTPTPVNNLSGVTRVRAGYLHTLALTSARSLYGWGSNYAGQLGDGSVSDAVIPRLARVLNVVSMAAGADHSIAVDSSGNAWTWGDDSRGQLGNDAAMSGVTLMPLKVLTGVSAVSAGMYHNVAMRSVGDVWAWGGNESGQVADGGTADVFVPKKTVFKDLARFISAGYYGGAAVTRHGELWTWGWNGYGQYGNGTTDGSATGGNFGVPTKSNHFYTYDVLLLAVAKASTGHLDGMKAALTSMAADVSRMSYGKVRFKVDAPAATYLASAADVGCNGNLDHDQYAILNFALAKAKAEGFDLSRYNHVMTQFDYDLTSSYGCDRPGASGYILNATGQAVNAPLLGKDTGWATEALWGQVGVHEFEHGYGVGRLRPHTGQISCGGTAPMSFGGTCTSDDDAPCNLYALGDGFVPAVVPTEYNENAAYKMTWQWIEPMRTTTRSASAAASYTIKLTPSDEATLAGTDIAAHQIALPSINGLTRYVVFEYRLHARIGNPPANANKPGVYAVYYENAYQAFLMKLGADDPTNYNGHKPLPIGVQTVVDPTLKVTVVSVTSTTATVKIDITP